MGEPETNARECDTDPKLTEDEWAYIEAIAGEGDS